MPPQMYSTGALQIHLNGPPPRLSPPSIYPENDWHNYPSYGSPNEANSGSPTFMMNNYSPTGNNSLSPFSIPPRASSNLPQVSPTSSDHSLSPLYGSSRFSTPTTPASASQPLMPSPTLSQVDHMLQQDSQVMTPDVCRIYPLILIYWIDVRSLIDLFTPIDSNWECSVRLYHFPGKVLDPSFPSPCISRTLLVTVNATLRTSCSKLLSTSLWNIPTNLEYHSTMHCIHGSRTLWTVSKSCSRVVVLVFPSDLRSVNLAPVLLFIASYLFVSGRVTDSGADRSQQRISVALLAP